MGCVIMSRKYNFNKNTENVLNSLLQMTETTKGEDKEKNTFVLIYLSHQHSHKLSHSDTAFPQVSYFA